MPRMHKAYNSAIAASDGEVTIDDEIYIMDGTQGLIVDVYHTSSGSATATYKIYAMPFTDDEENWLTTSPVAMLTSAAISKDTNTRLVVDPRVAAVTNTHASTVLPYRVKITCDVASADATAVFVSVTQVE